MGLNWKSIMPLTVILALLSYEELVSIPSCRPVPGNDPDDGGAIKEDPDDLRVMMVANLMLLGSDGRFFNTYFANYYMSKFFTKSFDKLRPDMLVVLGDISARGFELTSGKWLSVIHEFHGVLGPFREIPYQVVLGDRDVGQCSGLDENFVDWIAGILPGLDSSGSGAFEIGNVSFVSLNSVALLCGANSLRFGVEKLVERESTDLQPQAEGIRNANNEFSNVGAAFQGWRENAASSGSGPVLLLHFPLYRSSDNGYFSRSHPLNRIFDSSNEILNKFDSRNYLLGKLVGQGPYESLHTLPANATDYILQALRPRIIFSAHSHEYSDHIHPDGTREVTVPAMTWHARNDPGFILVTFRENNKIISISYCSLARKSHVLASYILLLLLFITSMVVAKTPRFRSFR